MLTRIESAFRDLRSCLGLRPNRHHKEDRVDGHIFISILAYHLLHSIEYKLRSLGEHVRWVTIKRIVSSHTYSTIQLPTTNGTVINIRKAGIPEAIHQEVYDKLEVDCQHPPVRRNLAWFRKVRRACRDCACNSLKIQYFFQSAKYGLERRTLWECRQPEHWP